MDLNWIDQEKFAKVTQITARRYQQLFDATRARKIAQQQDELRIKERLGRHKSSIITERTREKSENVKREPIKIRSSLIPCYVFNTFSR
jgi:hypothetical protein